jgi:hypothetical protein
MTTPPAAAAANVPVGYQSTLVATQHALVAASDASIVPKLIDALGQGRAIAQQIAHGVGVYADHQA